MLFTLDFFNFSNIGTHLVCEKINILHRYHSVGSTFEVNNYVNIISVYTSIIESYLIKAARHPNNSCVAYQTKEKEQIILILHFAETVCSTDTNH